MKEIELINILFAIIICIPVLLLWMYIQNTINTHKATEIRDRAFKKAFYGE